MDQTINSIAQLGGTVFTVVSFLYYLSKYQDKQIQAQVSLAVALENLTLKINSNTNSNEKNTNTTEEKNNTLK